jgi:hypothetical protein
MLRRAVAAPTIAVAAGSARGYVEIKGDTKFRLDKMLSEKDHKAALNRYWGEVSARKAKTFSNRKEELAHLAERPSYEYTSDLQRAANDLTHVMSSPLYYATDVPYHYSKLWKVYTASKTNSECGNGEVEAQRIIPQ